MWYILGFIIFAISSIALLYLNWRIRRGLSNITTFMIVPYLIVIAIQMINCIAFKLTSPPAEYWVIIFAFFIITMVGDNLGASFAQRVSINGVPIKKDYSIKESNSNFNSRIIDIVFVIIAIYCIYSFITNARSMPSITYIVQQEFQNTYGTNFYLKLILMLGVVYYWGTQKISFRTVVFGLMCMLPVVSSLVKGVIFIPLLASIYLRIKRKELNFTPKFVLILLSSGVVVFFLVYLIEEGVYGIEAITKSETYVKIFGKLLNYIVSGVQSFSQNLIYGVRPFREADNVTLAPIINFFSKFGIGESIQNVTGFYQKIFFHGGLNSNFTSNVNGYVGTLYLYNGLLVGNVINFIWAFISSLLQELYSERSDIYGALAGLYIAPFALGWFEFYFVHSFWVYLIILAVIVQIVGKFPVHFRFTHMRSNHGK